MDFLLLLSGLREERTREAVRAGDLATAALEGGRGAVGDDDRRRQTLQQRRSLELPPAQKVCHAVSRLKRAATAQTPEVPKGCRGLTGSGSLPRSRRGCRPKQVDELLQLKADLKPWTEVAGSAPLRALKKASHHR